VTEQSIRHPAQRAQGNASVNVSSSSVQPAHTKAQKKQINVNECERHVDGRYWTATEALYNTFSFTQRLQRPAVTVLTVHLEDDQQCYLKNFRQSSTEQKQIILRDAMTRSTKTDLLAFFRLCMNESLQNPQITKIHRRPKI